MLDFTICEFTVDYIDKAKALVKECYERERAHIPFMPPFSDTADKYGELQWFGGQKLGFCAVKDGELLAFFCYYPPFKGVYNTVTEFGSWSPLHAHGIKQMDEKETQAVWSRLVQAAMKRAAEEGSHYHSVTLFRHETVLREILCMYGFGYRCADSVLDVKAYQPGEKNFEEEVSVRQTTPEDFPVLRKLRRELSYHLTKSPCFCLHNEDQFADYIEDRETSEGLVTLGLYNSDDELFGLIDTTEDDGENFISEGKGIMNISGMFVREDYRGKGYARLLVDAAVEEAKNLGDPVLGVDYETMNPTARAFWEKYFTPYTISLVRHVDIGKE